MPVVWAKRSERVQKILIGGFEGVILAATAGACVSIARACSSFLLRRSSRDPHLRDAFKSGNGSRDSRYKVCRCKGGGEWRIG